MHGFHLGRGTSLVSRHCDRLRNYAGLAQRFTFPLAANKPGQKVLHSSEDDDWMPCYYLTLASNVDWTASSIFDIKILGPLHRQIIRVTNSIPHSSIAFHLTCSGASEAIVGC
jgi:hypothetical protein